MSVLYIALGGAIGAVARYLFSQQMTHWLGHGFPYGTLGVNILGSLLMGMLIGVAVKWADMSQTLHLFLAIGVLGGFTTFSSFSLDAVSLLQRGDYSGTLLYIVASVMTSISALFIGIWLMRLIPVGR